MNSRIITTSEKKIVLDRDGWCCNQCGYVPFHTFSDVPWWAKESYLSIHAFTLDIQRKKPCIVITWKITDDPTTKKLVGVLDWLQGGELEFDHIVPVRFGGSLDLDNIHALCHSCHRIKTGMEMFYTEHKKYSIHKYMGQLTTLP